MKDKLFRFLWVIILIICSFTLGYTLKPEKSSRRMPSFSSGARPDSSGSFRAPPLNFQRRR